MEDPEEVVDTVLSGLRAVAPPVGMEARIQLALQSHRADQTADSPFRFRLRRPALLGGFGGVLVVAAWCVAALCLFVLAGRRGAAKHPAEHPAEQAVTNTPASISTPESQSPFVTPGAGAVHPRAVRSSLPDRHEERPSRPQMQARQRCSSASRRRPCR